MDRNLVPALRRKRLELRPDRRIRQRRNRVCMNLPGDLDGWLCRKKESQAATLCADIVAKVPNCPALIFLL
jgi:hypothetical protein